MPPGKNTVRFTPVMGVIEDTGQAVTIQQPRKRKRIAGVRENVAMIDVDVLAKLELTAKEYRILFTLLSGVPPRGGNTSHMTMKAISDRTGIAAPNVSRAMRVFRERNIIRQVRQGIQEINPNLAYSGDFDSWSTACEGWLGPSLRRTAPDVSRPDDVID